MQVDNQVDEEASNAVINLARTLFEEADADSNGAVPLPSPPCHTCSSSGKIDGVELKAMMLKLWRHIGMVCMLLC